MFPPGLCRLQSELPLLGGRSANENVAAILEAMIIGPLPEPQGGGGGGKDKGGAGGGGSAEKAVKEAAQQQLLQAGVLGRVMEVSCNHLDNMCIFI